MAAAIERAALATAEFHIRNSFADGVPFWDTGAPGVAAFGDISGQASDPHNDVEPLDSSAAAICAQGYLRLGNYFLTRGDQERGGRYRGGAFTIAAALLSEPYLSCGPVPPGAAAALDLPPAQRLGPRPSGPAHPLRRVLDVGGLPPPRAGAADQARSRGRTLPGVFLKGATKVKITAIRTFIARFGNRPRALLKVETDEGLHGWGRRIRPVPNSPSSRWPTTCSR